jgi:hypothetical protein
MAVFEAAATGFHGLIETVLKELGYVGRMMLETIQRLKESQPGRYVITTPWLRRLLSSYPSSLFLLQVYVNL